MLNDEVIDKVVERLVDRIEQANTYILKEIGESINEIGTINPTKARQLVQMLKYGGNYDKIVKELARITNMNVKDIQDIFEEVAKNDYRFAKQFYDYRNKPYIPYEKNTVLKNQVEALANITAQEYINLTNTTALGFGMQDKYGNVVFKGIKDAYYDVLDEAVLSVSQGKETFNSAMYRQMKQLGQSGLKVIYPTTYMDKNGNIKHYTRRLDSAMRMNMNTALNNLHNEMQKQIAEEIEADGVEISAHEAPAPDHQEAQGRQFRNEEYEKLQTEGSAKTYDNIKIDMHIGKHFRPIREWNCKHYEFAIVLGVNKPQYSNERLQEIINDNNKGFDYEGKHYTMYEGTQLQRSIETAIRREKDTQIGAKASGLDDLVQDSQKNIRMLNKKYKELNDISGLRPQIERLKVEGYKRV